MSKTQDHYKKARSIIPGGTQLLSKRPELHAPGLWPCHFDRAKGAHIRDLDGKRYLDMSYSGIGACILGYADPDVNAAVIAAVERGSMSTLSCPEEIELAELLLEIHPWADMVRYTRTGGEAMAAAVRIARAKSGRDTVAFCGYHGWHDWYLAANLADENALDGQLLPGLEPLGVPRALAGTAIPFRYNRLDELEEIVARTGKELGAIVMEPVRNIPPEPGFFEGVRRLADENGLVLVIDEITAAWRVSSGGFHRRLDVTPDMAVFGKGMSNGFPMAAVIGKEDVMQAAQSTFISSTYWTERIGPAAAIATIRKFDEIGAAKLLVSAGKKILAGWRKAAKRSCLAVETNEDEPMAPLSHFTFQYENGQAMRTLFTQLMLERGILATGAFYASAAHGEDEIEAYLAAVDEVFSVIADARKKGGVEKMLKGPAAHTGFRRLN